MKFYQYLLIIPLSFLWISCSSSTETTSQTKIPELTSEPSFIQTQNLEVSIPFGWREIKDNHEQLFEIWLVSDNNKSAISFVPVLIDSSLIERPIEEQLTLIEKIIMNKRKSTADDFQLLNNNSTLLENKRSVTFEINGFVQNSILFGDGTTFYECLAYFDNGYEPTTTEIEELFATQEIIVAESVLK